MHVTSSYHIEQCNSRLLNTQVVTYSFPDVETGRIRVKHEHIDSKYILEDKQNLYYVYIFVCSTKPNV